MKILDSDHCVAILRGLLDLEGRLAPDEALGVTTISLGELAHEAHKSQRAAENLARLDVLLSALNVLSYDESAARLFSQLKARLEREGKRIPDLDLQIASIALASGLPLVAHNQRHFAPLVDLAGLSLDDLL